MALFFSLFCVYFPKYNEKSIYLFRIGESPSICPFLKNNGHEAPKGPSAIIFQEWTDTRTFSYLKYTLIYNYV